MSAHGFPAEVKVRCWAKDCDRTGRFLIEDEKDRLGLHGELMLHPWMCIYHDTEWQWHTRRPDREAAQKLFAGT